MSAEAIVYTSDTDFNFASRETCFSFSIILAFFGLVAFLTISTIFLGLRGIFSISVVFANLVYPAYISILFYRDKLEMSLNQLGSTFPFTPLLDLIGNTLYINYTGSNSVDLSAVGGNASDWATYAATTDVDLSGNVLFNSGRVETGIIRTGLIEPQLGGSNINVDGNFLTTGSISTTQDVYVSSISMLGLYSTVQAGGGGGDPALSNAVSTLTQKTDGIISYDAGGRLTTFENNSPPFVANQGIQVFGDVQCGFSPPYVSLLALGNGINLNALYNKLGISPTELGQVSSIVNYSVVGTPSEWIPDNQPPTLGTDNSWRHIKPAGAPGVGIKINWAMYNPYFGQALPYTVPASPVILRKNLNAVWAVIRPVANIAVQGAIFFNIYTYDVSSPPVGGFTSRWDYNANNLALPLTTGAQTLCAGFKYLIYCYDAPKIVATPANLTTITQANGQYPTQTYATRLQDPYDIYPDIPHIPFSAVSLHPNPQTAPVPLDVQVSGIALNTTSSSLTAGLDVEVLAFGYKAEGYLNYQYVLEFA